MCLLYDYIHNKQQHACPLLFASSFVAVVVIVVVSICPEHKKSLGEKKNGRPTKRILHIMFIATCPCISLFSCGRSYILDVSSCIFFSFLQQTSYIISRGWVNYFLHFFLYHFHNFPRLGCWLQEKSRVGHNFFMKQVEWIENGLNGNEERREEDDGENKMLTNIYCCSLASSSSSSSSFQCEWDCQGEKKQEDKHFHRAAHRK